jgi:tRNA1Val (adenine37-N6)-methyltransferase
MAMTEQGGTGTSRTFFEELLQRAEIPLGDGETLDGVGRGEVLVIQRRGGYRFAVDALALAAFAGLPRGPVVDLGTGCGIVALLLASRGVRSVVGVELQASLFELAYKNVALNRRGDQVRIVRADLRQLRGVLPPRSFDLVVANPPYVPLKAGFVNPVSERAIARHEVACSPVEVAEAARYLLADGGALKVIFPSSRLAELVVTFAAAGLEARRMRLVHPVPNRPAKMVLLETVKGRKGALEVLPPLFLFDTSGAYSPDLKEIVGDVPLEIEREVGA